MTKSLTPNFLAPSSVNKPTASSAYSSTSGVTKDLSHGAKI